MNYILFGEEEYLIEKRTNELLKEVLGVDYKMSAVSYDALETPMEVILDDAMMLPFFSEKKVIIIHNPYFLTASLSSNLELNEELLFSYLANRNDMTVLIFVCPYNLDERRKIVKKCRSLCFVEEFKKLDDFEIKRFVSNELKNYQVQIKEKDIDYLCQCLGGDILSIKKEIEKLQLFDGVVTKEVINALISKPLEDNIFELVNAVMARDIKKSFLIWKDFLLLNKEPLQLIGALAAQFRFCYQVSFLTQQGYRDDEIARELSCKPFRVTKTKQIMHRGTPDKFLDLLSQLSTLDQNIKNGMIDKKNGFELFLIKVGMEGTYGINHRAL